MVRDMKRALTALTLAVVSSASLVGTASAAPAAERAALSKKPAQAVSKFMAAIEDGDTKTACALLVPKYATQQAAMFAEAGYIEPGSTCPDMIAAISELVEEIGGYGKVATKTTSVKGTKATVRMTLPKMDSVEIHTLRLVGGRWLLAGQREG
jgi:hypothetical protein